MQFTVNIEGSALKYLNSAMRLYNISAEEVIRVALQNAGVGFDIGLDIALIDVKMHMGLSEEEENNFRSLKCGCHFDLFPSMHVRKALDEIKEERLLNDS